MKGNATVNNLYGNATTFPGYVKPADFLCTDVSDELYTVFRNKYDTRYYENLQQVGGSGTLYGINKYAFTNAQVNTGTADITTTYMGAYTKDYCHANWIIYRLTDVMLMKAEALVEMVNDEDSTEVGKERATELLNQAFQIVNAISKRSNCSSSNKDIDQANLTTKSQLQALVIEERQRELMFEGKRWFDLVRRSRRDGNTNYLVGVVSRKGSSGGTAISSKLSRMDAIFWPYNNDEIKVNKNLVQNPAFGSGENNSYQNTTK